MSFVRREIYTKDKEIQRYLDKLIKDSVVETPPRIAMDIGRNKTIRRIRDLDHQNPLIIIANDRKYGISLIKIRKPVTIIKNGDKYVFSV
jgi:hypothetical protein